MSLATVEQVQAALAASKPEVDQWGYPRDNAAHLRRAIAASLPAANRAGAERGTYKITPADIKQFLARDLELALRHQLGKGPRPWNIVNVTEKLDPAQPWIGIEYETGYTTNEDYQKVINFVWHNFNNSTIDSEGGSNYPCELTFPPINFNDFMSDKGPMDQLYAFMDANKINVDDDWSAHWRGSEDDYGYSGSSDDDDPQEGSVGTHCNISTPTFRLLTGNRCGEVADVLNHSLGALSETAVREFLGRVPYGGFNERGGGTQRWIEGKLFKSTASAKQWEGYKKVIAKLAEAQEAVSVALRDGNKSTYKNGRHLIITNFRKFLYGEDEEPVLGYRSNTDGGWSFDW